LKNAKKAKNINTVAHFSAATIMNGPHALKTRARSEKTLPIKLSEACKKPDKGGQQRVGTTQDMVLCYLTFIQPHCVLRYLASHTSSDCTSGSVAQNHILSIVQRRKLC
jgi:hypothetical protein